MAPALVLVVSLWLVSGCGQPAAIFEAPAQPQLQPCNANAPCPRDQVCEQNICVAPHRSTGSTIGDGTGDTPDVEDPSSTQPDAEDTGGIPDPGSTTPDPGQDTGQEEPADTGPPVDTGPPEPGPDACTIPGKVDECDDPTKNGCRVEPDGQLRCSGSESYNPYSSPCSTHAQCDIILGCHFGMCTSYCELQFGDASCLGGAKCKNVGNATWGACAP